jgi:glucosamine-6-phosphate deaminase
MEVIIMNNYDEVCREASDIIVEAWRKKNDLVLGLATGSTALGVYGRLIEAYKNGEIDFSTVRTFNLDEYLGLPENDPHSYAYFMDQNFFRHVNIKRVNIHRLSGKPRDIEDHCRAYEEAIEHEGGIDLQLLGLGRNGHIGFNEPGSSLSSLTRFKILTRETVADNARFFGQGETVPRFILTMGIGTILRARSVVILAYGANKSEAIFRSVEGPVTATVPGSALQLHQRAILVVDEDAARHLSQKDYYKWAYQNKGRVSEFLK